MSLPHNEHALGKSLRNKKKRSAVFIVIVVSIAAHILGGGVLAVIKIAEVLKEEPEFEASPVVAQEPPPPPPPPPPTARRTQKSMPRPQPLAAQNPQNIDVPAIEINNADLNMVTGRGLGGGFGEVGGGVADAINISAFGFDQALEGTLKGTLYDLKQDTEGELIEHNGHPVDAGGRIFKDFTNNFNISRIDRRFFKSDKSLYGSYFIIPLQSAASAPRAYGVEGKVQPQMIGVTYKGKFKPKESGRFRFHGRADDILVVRVNRRVVLDASATLKNYSSWNQGTAARKHDEENPRQNFGFGMNGMTGDWFTLTEDQETDLELLVGEIPGGRFGCYLLIEKQGTPGLKVFSSRPLSDQDKNFLRRLHPDVSQFL